MVAITPPDEIYEELFEAVQTGRVFDDSKTFADAIPRAEPAAILESFHAQQGHPGFDLATFVGANFEIPRISQVQAEAGGRRALREYIESLWDRLQRPADEPGGNSSLIPLPRPYIVPGGRFREIYYWDSYFTMLGLAASGRIGLIEDMVENFAYLIGQVGFIPNGNRSYYCTRSQPPLFAMMLELLAEASGRPEIVADYLEPLEREYRFWMSGAEEMGEGEIARRRVVRTNGGLLNRYWDDSDRPRPESYAEDLRLAGAGRSSPSQLYRDIRAACESGWDFSSRWLADRQDISTIRTSRVVPVDLNAILFKLERTLAEACGMAGRRGDEKFYRERAERRGGLIRKLFFDDKSGIFLDLLIPDFKCLDSPSLATAFPLFFEIATPQQAKQVCRRLGEDFLKPGGWVTTLAETGQQWDAPNGWAPLQWVVHTGLANYGFSGEADRGARRWVQNNIELYQRTGKLFEKYNVVEVGRLTGGGEYELQHGFGWTNGVLLSLMDRLGIP